MKNLFGPEYASLDDTGFVAKYRAACFCGAVQYEVSADPVDAKICHCQVCQKLHGAPMQWAAIFHKRHVRFTAGWRIWSSIIMNKAGGNGFYLAKSAVSSVAHPLLMKGAGCGLPSHHYLILGFPLRCRIRSNQPVKYFMATR